MDYTDCVEHIREGAGCWMLPACPPKTVPELVEGQRRRGLPDTLGAGKAGIWVLLMPGFYKFTHTLIETPDFASTPSAAKGDEAIPLYIT